MTDELEIPDSAFEIKATYLERPDKATVRLIKEYIRTYGTPHLWWGHTHTKPTVGSHVTFLGKYSLPPTHHQRAKWAPCPCCSLRRPKYFRQGLIAWFRDEGVIRCVGDQCYKKMDPEGYRLAMDQLDAETKAENTIDFLIARIPNIPGYLKLIDGNLPIVRAVDEMKNSLVHTLEVRLAIQMWPEISTGMLRTVVVRNEIRRLRNGDEEIRQISDFRDYATVPGHIALKPGRSTLASKLSARRDNLDAINFGKESEVKIVAMSDAERSQVAKVLSFCHQQANKYVAEARAIRAFFAKSPSATINGWANEPNSPFRIHLGVSDDAFLVGRSAESHFQLKWPDHFWNVLQELDPLSKAMAA